MVTEINEPTMRSLKDINFINVLSGHKIIIFPLLEFEQAYFLNFTIVRMSAHLRLYTSEFANICFMKN